MLVKWFVEEMYTEKALLVRRDHIAGCIRILSPKYALLEIADAFRKYAARKIINHDDVVEALNILAEFDIEFIDLNKEQLMEALKYSLRNHITVYDAYYIVLAHKFSSHFYTADEKLLGRIQAIENTARHIKDYEPKCIE